MDWISAGAVLPIILADAELASKRGLRVTIGNSPPQLRCTSLPALRSQFAHADARGSAPVKVKSSPHKDDMDAPLRQTQHHSPRIIEVAGGSGYSLLRALLFLRALATGVPDT
jgi:hypothetical protein